MRASFKAIAPIKISIVPRVLRPKPIVVAGFEANPAKRAPKKAPINRADHIKQKRAAIMGKLKFSIKFTLKPIDIKKMGAKKFMMKSSS